jgi:hypothetical protein
MCFDVAKRGVQNSGPVPERRRILDSNAAKLFDQFRMKSGALAQVVDSQPWPVLVP